MMEKKIVAYQDNNFTKVECHLTKEEYERIRHSYGAYEEIEFRGMTGKVQVLKESSDETQQKVYFELELTKN